MYNVQAAQQAALGNGSRIRVMFAHPSFLAFHGACAIQGSARSPKLTCNGQFTSDWRFRCQDAELCWFDLAAMIVRIFRMKTIDRLTISSILVKHEGSTSLNLGFENSIPELLGIDGLATATLTLIFLVELLKLITPDLVEARCFIRTEQRPLSVSLDTFHASSNDISDRKEEYCKLTHKRSGIHKA